MAEHSPTVLTGGSWVERPGGLRVWVETPAEPIAEPRADAPVRPRPKPPARCGTPRGYQDHYYAGDVACEACLAAHAERARARGAIARVLQPCGTPAAYRRHLRHGEVPCRPCLDAIARRQRERQARPTAR